MGIRYATSPASILCLNKDRRNALNTQWHLFKFPSAATSRYGSSCAQRGVIQNGAPANGAGAHFRDLCPAGENGSHCPAWLRWRLTAFRGGHSEQSPLKSTTEGLPAQEEMGLRRADLGIALADLISGIHGTEDFGKGLFCEGAPTQRFFWKYNHDRLTNGKPICIRISRSYVQSFSSGTNSGLTADPQTPDKGQPRSGYRRGYQGKALTFKP